MMEKLTKTLSKTLATYSRLKSMKALQQSRGICCSRVAQYKWEPDGLKLEPDIPIHNPLNLCLYSYDYVLLESFARYVYRAAQDQKVAADKWVVPVKKLKVNTMKPKTKVITDTCNINRYQRVVQLESIESITLPILLERIRQNTPEGVEVEVKEHEDEDEEFLYVPDLERQSLEMELKKMEEQKDQKKK